MFLVFLQIYIALKLFNYFIKILKTLTKELDGGSKI